MALPLKNLKVALFEHATIATLVSDFNDWTAGKAISASASYSAGFVKEQQVLFAHYIADTNKSHLAVFYTE